MFDLDAYLGRIGLAGVAREPSPATLHAVCAAQPAHIAFENFDPLLGRPPGLGPDVLQAKMLVRRRGGYCYELNRVLQLALDALGFDATGLAARVLWGQAADAPQRPRSHMLLRVVLPDGTAHLADAGFGGQLLDRPLRLEPGLEQPGPRGCERLVRVGNAMRLETLLAGRWLPVYEFGPEPFAAVDYEPLNWFTATRPGAMFAHNLLLERLTPRGRIGLLNDRLSVREGDAPAELHRIADAADLGRVLDAQFELDPPVSPAELFDRLPKGLDGPHLPAA